MGNISEPKEVPVYDAGGNIIGYTTNEKVQESGDKARDAGFSFGAPLTGLRPGGSMGFPEGISLAAPTWNPVTGQNEGGGPVYLDGRPMDDYGRQAVWEWAQRTAGSSLRPKDDTGPSWPSGPTAGEGGYTTPEEDRLTPPTGGDPFVPPSGGTSPPVDWGTPGGVGGVEGPSGVDTPLDMDPFNPANQIGFGNSSNRDFYRLQSAAQRASGFRNAMREEAARKRAAESANRERPPMSADDMWAWAGGEGQFTPTMGTGKPTPVESMFNQEFAGLDPSQIWNKVSDYDVFSSSDSSKSARDVLNNLFGNQSRVEAFGDWDPSKYTNATDAFNALDSSIWAGMNRPNVAAQGLQDVLNQLYSTSEYGPAAPPGYAAPI